MLGAIPFYGPVRVALLLATMATPWRFRTKRNLWAYAGLAVVTCSGADHTFVVGQPVRRRPPRRGPVRCRTFTMSWWPAGCGRRWHA
ncbi:MAG: transposase [Gemmatimonadetes bacterium]|nr:transposase [Gemmatimonadota bacterium]